MELAGWWPRVGATLVDGVLVVAATVAILWPAGFDFDEWLESSSLLFSAREVDLVGLAVQLAVALPYYLATMLAWEGRTVGKRALGIRVVRADGRPLGAWTIVLRQGIVQYVAGVLLPLFSTIDYLLPLADRQNRAVHDHLARTRVVRA